MGRIHAKNLAAAPGVTLAAVCDFAAPAAQKLNADIAGGAAAVYDNIDRMLDTAKLDALYVCLPPFAHEGQVEKAAARGLHLFIEKPLGLTVARAESITRAVEAAGVVSLVGYHMRHSEPVRRLKGMLDDGSAGKPTMFTGSFICNALHGAWWRDVNRSGGQLFEQAIHIYDLALHLLGQPVFTCGLAENLCHQNAEGYTVEDTSAALIHFTGGAMATITASNCAVPTEWRSELRVICEKVTVDFRSHTDATFSFSGGLPAEEYWRTGKKVATDVVTDKSDLYLAETTNFLASIRGEATSMAPAAAGLLGVKLCLATLASAHAGGTPQPI
jgi:predicted dehydrogenase